MIKYIRYNELIFFANKYINFSCEPTHYKKYKENTILDENKSIKWNREEILKRNLLCNDEMKNLSRQKNQMYTELTNLIKMYIMQKISVSEKKATKIFNYLSEESNDSLEYINRLDDLLELFVDDGKGAFMREETKPTVLVIKNRGKGKSTQLVYTSATTQYPIIVSTKVQIIHLLELAEELDVVIPKPMTIEDYKSKRTSFNNILIDEGYDLIGEALDAYMSSHVAAVTLSDKVKEMGNIRKISI